MTHENDEKQATAFKYMVGECIYLLKAMDAEKYQNAIDYLNRTSMKIDFDNVCLLLKILKFSKNFNDSWLMTEILKINLSVLQNLAKVDDINGDIELVTEASKESEPSNSLKAILETLISDQLEKINLSSANELKTIEFCLEQLGIGLLMTVLPAVFAGIILNASVGCTVAVTTVCFFMWMKILIDNIQNHENQLTKNGMDFQTLSNDSHYNKFLIKN